MGDGRGIYYDKYDILVIYRHNLKEEGASKFGREGTGDGRSNKHMYNIYYSHNRKDSKSFFLEVPE